MVVVAGMQICDAGRLQNFEKVSKSLVVILNQLHMILHVYEYVTYVKQLL